HRLPEAVSVEKWRAEAQTEHRKLVQTALQPYEDIIIGRAVEFLTWPPDLFFDGAQHGKHVLGPVELAGRSRFLKYGPYMHLPLGQWVANVHFSVGESFSKNSVLVDVESGKELASGHIVFPEFGS